MKTFKQFLSEMQSPTGITIGSNGEHKLHGVSVQVKRAEPKAGLLSRMFASKPAPRQSELERRIDIHGKTADIQTPFHDVVGMKSSADINHARQAVTNYGHSSYSLNTSLHKGSSLSPEDQHTHQGMQKAIALSGPTRQTGEVFSGTSKFLSSHNSVRSGKVNLPAYTSFSPDRSVGERFAKQSIERADAGSSQDHSHPHYLHFQGQEHRNQAIEQSDVHHFINGTASPELHKKYGIKSGEKVEARPFVNMIHATLPKGSKAVNLSKPGEEITGHGEHEAELVVGPGSKFHRTGITMDLHKGMLIHHGTIQTD